MAYEYIENFKRLGFGMFIHFGLYSVIGKCILVGLFFMF